MIPVTKPYLPERAKFEKLVDKVYDSEWLTNNGPMAQELTARLAAYLGVENLLLVSNGTLALQIAYQALGISASENGDANAITTPFTFVATPSSLKWEGVKPVFADIRQDTWCLDERRIENLIDVKTKAIVPVHVYGNACAVEAIERIATERNLKVVYDAAHAFGVNYKGKSLLLHGDAATLSFHATKVFHTIEGGAIVFKHKQDLEKAKGLINFGITGPDQISGPGINAKLNEIQAAMGLCVLDDIESIIERRMDLVHAYDKALASHQGLRRPEFSIHASRNGAYYPVAFESEGEALRVQQRLSKQGVQLRRYFYPSLDTLTHEYGVQPECTVSRDIAKRVMCLPVYHRLSYTDVKSISNMIL